MKTGIMALAFAGFFTFSTFGGSPSVEISTSFATDPAKQGWATFGNSSLFKWNSASNRLDVTWDSSKPNSYYYHPLGTVLSRHDDFAMEFDLTIHDVSGIYFELGLGFLNFTNATSAGFLRGTGSDSFSLAEFDYFPGDPDGSVMPTFAATNNWNLQFGSPGSPFSSGDYNKSIFTLPTGRSLHVAIGYTSTNSSALLAVSDDSSVIVSYSITLDAGFTDFRCDTFAIESFNDTGAWGGNILAHGSVSNVKLTVPVSPLQNISGQLQSGKWVVTFESQTGWWYVLERSTDLASWAPAADPISGTGSVCTLEDSNASTATRFYRVRAARPY